MFWQKFVKESSAQARDASNTIHEKSQELRISNVGQLSGNRLFTHFKRYGNIQRINIVKDHKTGERKGTAFIKFDSVAAATAAGQDGNEAEVSEYIGGQDACDKLTHVASFLT